MADIELDDIDGPTQAPARISRFAPKKRSKPQLKSTPKDEAASSEPAPPQSLDYDSIPLPKKEELESKPLLVDSFIATSSKPEHEPSAACDTVEMGEEAELEGENPKEDPMEIDGGDRGEDEVVREIDVYFTPSIDPNTQLYVLQYPLRPLWRPYELDDRCEEVRVKPTSAEVEVDLAVDVDSKNYDPEFAIPMTKQTFSSTWKPPRTSGYAAGVLMGNKLYLCPIHAVVQLRPSMQHLNSGGLRKKNNVTSNVESTIKSEGPNDEKSIGSSRKQSKTPGVPNEQKTDTGESWVSLKYHGSKSNFAARYLRKMLGQETQPIQFSMSPRDYVSLLCPGALNENIKHRGPSRRFLLSLPLEERYKAWLLEGPPVHRFDALKHLASDVPNEDVLGVLQKYAQLVQGLWVPKSSLLYGKDTGLEILARNYVLLLFSKGSVIEKAQLPQKAELAKAMNAVLHVLAVERESFKDWKFKEPMDISFIKLNPNIVKEQEQAWERLEKQIVDVIFGGKNRPNMKNPLKPNTVNRPVTSNNLNKGGPETSNGALSRMPMSDATREALPKALQRVFQTCKVCSLQLICQRLREMAVSESSRPKGVAKEAIAAAIGADAPQEEFLAIIDQVAIKVHGVYVLKSSPDHPQFDGLRKIVIDLLIAEGPNAKLKKASIMEAAKMQLKRDITPIEYQKVLNELCTSQGSAWVLRSGDGNPK